MTQTHYRPSRVLQSAARKARADRARLRMAKIKYRYKNKRYKNPEAYDKAAEDTKRLIGDRPKHKKALGHLNLRTRAKITLPKLKFMETK